MYWLGLFYRWHRAKHGPIVSAWLAWKDATKPLPF